MSANESVIFVTVAPVPPDSLKITWSWKGLPFEPYSIDGGMVRRTSDRVRAPLKRLVQHVMRRGVPGSGPLLKALAESGAELRETLFHSDTGALTPSEVAAWLPRLPGPQRLVFLIDARVHVPWGLIYDADPGELPGGPNDTDIHLYEGFWCLKYYLSSVYARIGPRGLSPRAKHDLEIIPVVNKDAYEKASEDAPTDDWILNRVRAQCGQPLFSSRELFDRWSGFSGKHALIYLYCHANQTRLALSGGDEIHVDTLRRKLQRPDISGDDHPSIMFLNGCATAVGDPSGGFLEAAGGPRFCGFIGTETESPDVFALRFGAAFVHALLTSGKPVFEIMNALRRRHWPLSLLYSVNCYPEFRAEPEDDSVAGPGGIASAESLLDNYSLGPVGSREL